MKRAVCLMGRCFANGTKVRNERDGEISFTSNKMVVFKNNAQAWSVSPSRALPYIKLVKASIELPVPH